MRGIELTDDGLRINKAGTYSITFTAVIQNPSTEYSAIFPVFLAFNDQFNPDDPRGLGATAFLCPGSGDLACASGETLTSTATIPNIPCGTKISLVVSNGGSPQPEPLRIFGWGISVHRIPEDTSASGCAPCCSS